MAPPTPQPARERASNVALWSVFAVTALAVGCYFLVRVHRHVDADSLLGLVGLLGRTALYVSAGLLLEGLLMRAGDRSRAPSRPASVALHVLWVFVMLLSVALIVDLVMFLYAGYHLPTGFRIVFGGGPRAVETTVEATGVSLGQVVAVVLAVALAVALAVYLSRVLYRVSCRRGLEIPRRTSFSAFFVCLGGIAVLEMVAFNVRNPFLWEAEIRSVPLAFAIVRPEADLASLRIAPRRPPPARERAAAATAGLEPLGRKPDVFVFMLESLRKDVMTPEVMPHLSTFAAGAWTFEHPVTTGNATHYSWYGLFCAEPPLFYDAVRLAPEEHGSVPLAVLRQLGYRVELYATPNTEYQDLQTIVFGQGGAVLDREFHPDAPLPEDRDRAVVDELVRTLQARPPGGVVHIVALDSSHFEYSWGAEFQPPFTPYMASDLLAKDRGRALQTRELDARARAVIFNRYKNAVAWVDSLVGRALDAIQATGRMDRSYVVLTGDHGEAFWEHGVGSHGSQLRTEQMEVAFAMRLPGRAPRHFQSVFSLMDVMPTILRDLGYSRTGVFDGVPLQARLPAGAAASGRGAELAPREALTFQSWNERVYKFSLTGERERMFFELDDPDPLRSRRVALKDVTDLRDVSLLDPGGKDVAAVYDRVLRRIPALVNELTFLGP